MRKDYLPAPAYAVHTEETAFVEQYWTRRWDGHDPGAWTEVAQSEEFRVVHPFLNQLPRGSRILDGGCGLGEWVLFLASRGFDAVGLDLSEAVVERLKSQHPERQFVRGDIRHTDFGTGSFDAYLSWGAFEHFEIGLGPCLAEASRVVRPGGWLFVSVPFHNWRLMLREARALHRWDETFDRQSGYLQPQRFYQWRLTRPELQRELELHGFRVRSVAPIGKLVGAGRLLQWDLPLFTKGSRAYRVAQRALALMLPAAFISHMILAVGQRR